MKALSEMHGLGTTNRRAFVKQFACAAAAAALTRRLAAQDALACDTAPSEALAQSSDIPLPPVVSFHLDQPYLDMSGRGVPYHPPSGLRSGQAASELSDYHFRFARPYG